MYTGQPFSNKDKRALKWAKRLLMVSMFGIACVMLGVSLSGCVVKDTVTRPSSVFQTYDSRASQWRDSVMEECAVNAMIDAPTMPEADGLYNQCVLESGITI